MTRAGTGEDEGAGGTALAHGTRAVVVAAGNATRMRGAGGARKPLIELAGRPLLEHACAALDSAASITSIVLVVHADDRDAVEALVAPGRPGGTGGTGPFRKVRAIVPGGAERCDSVRIGCTVPAEDEPPFDLVCIHDAARPFVSAEAIDRVVELARREGGALLAIPVKDTLKRSLDGTHATETVDRASLWAAQTPQVFERERFLACIESAARDGVQPTDDAALWERYVGPVAIARGEARADKITGPEDLELARLVVERDVANAASPERTTR